MKIRIIFFVCFLLSGLCHAQTGKHRTLNIQTFLVKSKKNEAFHVDYYKDYIHFEKSILHLRLKKSLKLFTNIFTVNDSCKHYLFEHNSNTDSKRVLCITTKMEGKKNDFLLKSYNSMLPERLIYRKHQFIYPTNNDYYYIIALKADKNHKYKFLIKSEIEKLTSHLDKTIILSTKQIHKSYML